MIQTFEKDVRKIKYKIIIKNNKHTYFHFKDGLLVITKNKRVPIDKVLFIINRDFDIIYQKLNSKIKLNEGEILYFGKVYNLVLLESTRFKYDIYEDVITIYKTPKQTNEIAINRFYKEELFNKILNLGPEVEKTINKLGLNLVKFKIKDVKTYYGKCFIDRKEIVYALKLAMLDPIFLEYVIYHEYAHFKEANHSKKFYDLLSKMMPNHREVQRKLNKTKV